MRKIFLVILFAILILIGFIAYKTISAPNKQSKIEASALPALLDSALTHFQQSISYQTVSFGDAKNGTRFLLLILENS